MTDNLRDRIAAVIHDYSVPIPMAKLVADAVIAELRHEFWLHDESRWLRADDE